MHRLLYFAYFLLFPFGLYAYLDPGSGSALLYALVGLFISLAYFAQGLWLDLSLRLGRAKEDRGFLGSEADLLFHSEGPQYDHLFYPLLELFAGSERRIAYVTQYGRPEGRFPPLPPSIRHIALDAGPKGFATLNLARAKVFVTTTPQLGVMMFKRSRRVSHYCHLLHAASDISTYRFFAFDQFDSVLCAGEYMKESFRELERQRGTRPKRLYTTGITYFDAFARMPAAPAPAPGRKTLLVAPSWGPNGLFSVYGTGFLRRLPRDCDLVLRPHPQLRISQRELYDELVGLARELGMEIDESPSNAAALARADLLVTDFSGVGYDFALGYGKPVIVMDTHMDYSLFEGRFLNTSPWPEGVRSSVGIEVDESRLEELPAIVAEALSRGGEGAAELRGRYLANFGRACEVAKAQLLEILDGVA